MKTRKIFALCLSALLAASAIPAVSLAKGVSDITLETSAASKLDTVWSRLSKAEAEAMNAGLDRADVINSVYSAALNIDLVDVDSFQSFSKDGFFFTTDGMFCSYNYRLRNELQKSSEPPVDTLSKTQPKKAENAENNEAFAKDVLLVAPYYGYDNNFTDQYKEESLSVAETTGGERTLIQGHAATGPEIAKNYTDKCVVFYDSHGIQTGDSSYLCLTTNSGITADDYANGWAVNTGDSAYIDGRYIENHIEKPLSDTFVWMAICEGMKYEGRGTTGSALIAAGAGGVYGYSQEVSFDGEYEFESVFWDEMKKGAAVFEAIAIMKETVGLCDEYTYPSAWPIVMSKSDPFPANPDAPQQVNCYWTLFDGSTLFDLEAFELSDDMLDIVIGGTASVSLLKVPENANNYHIAWTSSDESIAKVEGDYSYCRISAIDVGTAVITCTAYVDEALIGTATVTVNVTDNTNLNNALNIENGKLKFIVEGSFPFVAASNEERTFAESTNAGSGGSASIMRTELFMREGETLSFEYFTSTEKQYDEFLFTVNGKQEFKDSGITNWTEYTFTAPKDDKYVFVWSYKKDDSVNKNLDCVRIDNVKYSGTIIEPDGDVDLNGKVAVSDAILALRMSLGLLEPTDEQLAHGDFDANRSISVAEAIIILRTSMGLS